MIEPGDARLRYDVVDVFTDRPYAGNPLAVVHGADELDTDQLQRIARQFNLSETAFPMRPTRQGADYRLRIFTPAKELPFAGHPSVGSAWVLARDGVIGVGEAVQECGAGLLPISVDQAGATLTGGAAHVGADLSATALAAAAGLEPSDVDSAGEPGIAGCGIDFAYLLVRPGAVSRAVVAEAAAKRAGVPHGLVVASYDRETNAAHARMFAPQLGVREDPATGSAALGLGVWLASRGLVADGDTRYVVSQGAEIGRPSTLDCIVSVRDREVIKATVRGGVAPVASGTIAIP
ncbi:PhzF family phenazine biosynthesis protein [Allokutzneria albata]|uniref:Trans-2,3-dihydro-3-hydroxyanthranilate isomerase n=1 Tax=Allokutzneria albata TaxID=211114 RepID=A0A1G9YK73_ALLAB|nr:PhzF family phenazine biosynthesis protein [Allokutzneria albata]SDN08875.1 trans-2,3-dihydro-3-hydroxyanthranilate isomerase [Allokutzneria albata]